MRAFAAFIMRGRLPAVAVVAGTAVLPLLMWVGGAALALVTLRRGLWDGLLVGGAATAVLALLAMTAAGTSAPALQPVVQLWLPVLLLSAWLRHSVSLARTLELAAGLGAIAVAGLYLAIPDPAAYWAGMLEEIRQALGAEPGDQAAWQAVVDRFAPVMTGLWALSLLSLAVVSLLLGRWWQALLYNPGGFRQEFHSLRLEVWYAALAILLLGGGLLEGAGLVYDLGLVVASVFTFQALAVAHDIVARRGWSTAWLVGMYLLLPLVLRAVAVVGIADVFLNLRQRVAGPAGRA